MPFQCAAEKLYFSIFIFNFPSPNQLNRLLWPRKFRRRKFFFDKNPLTNAATPTHKIGFFFAPSHQKLVSTMSFFLEYFPIHSYSTIVVADVCVRAHVKSTRKEFKRWNGLTTCAKQFTTFFSLLVRFQLSAATIVKKFGHVLDVVCKVCTLDKPCNAGPCVWMLMSNTEERERGKKRTNERIPYF